MNVTLGIASSISSYKAAEILRLLQKAGHTVRVIMTRNATQFVRPILFQSLSGHPVYLDEFKAKKGEVLHVELARQTDLLLVAPATANTIGKFASGIADDFLTTFFLARRCPALIAPAMNIYMYRNPVVQQNIQSLRSMGVAFIEPDEGYLACGDEGAGRLAEEEEIVRKALSILTATGSLQKKHVVVTAGPTWETLDAVRIITNRSSGKMGYALASEAAARGARVTLISGPTSLLPPSNVRVVNVESAEEMKQAVLAVYDSADYVIKAAAVSDFRPSRPFSGKKKKSSHQETVTLEPTTDILALLGQKKENQILIGFCAETENLEQNARLKLENKNLDFIVANRVGPQEGFQTDHNELLLIDRLGNRVELGPEKKTLLASKLWDIIVERTAAIRKQPIPTRA